ncbi:MAG: UDP-N-acetylmuramoyl-tripeptide--D-alanyl-D-alanine ligase [Acidobacteriota bacterium]
MKLSEIAQLIQIPDLPAELANREPTGYSIDSRTVQQGDLFFAIKGEKFDGHDFVADALSRGALAAVVARTLPIDKDLLVRLIKVEEPLVALQQLAQGVLQKWGKQIVGITGSAGKTTTKELTSLVLSRAGRVLKSTGNLNNTYGLPLSVLKMVSNGAAPSDYDFAVLEMGMSTPGEIRRLCEIAPPDVGAVVNVNAVHLEFFASLQAIADAKAELIEGLKPQALAVLNADDELVRAMAERHNGPLKMIGIESPADVRAVKITENGLLGTKFHLVTPQGEVEAELPLAGRHILYNALIAAAIGDHYGLTPAQIAEALRDASAAKHRGEVIQFRAGFTVVDDSYNSNPRALDEMVRMLAAVQGVSRRIVVAGEMLELGPTGKELHRSCGQQIALNNIDLLIGVRGLAREIVTGAIAAGMPAEQACYFDTCEDAAEWLSERLQKGALVLVKGSRGVKTELIIDALKHKFESEGA